MELLGTFRFIGYWHQFSLCCDEFGKCLEGYYGLNCVLPKFLCWRSHSDMAVLGDRAWSRSLRLNEVAGTLLLQDWHSFEERKRHQSSFTLPALAGTGHVQTRREGGLLQPGKDRRLTRNQTRQHLDLAPQTSSTVRKYVCSKHPVCGLLYGSLADQCKWKCWEGGLTSVGFLPKCDLGLSSPGVLATPRPPLVSPALWLCQRSDQGRSFSGGLGMAF